MSSIDSRRLDQSFRLKAPAPRVLTVKICMYRRIRTDRLAGMVSAHCGRPYFVFLFCCFGERESGIGLEGYLEQRRAFKSIASSG